MSFYSETEIFDMQCREEQRVFKVRKVILSRIENGLVGIIKKTGETDGNCSNNSTKSKSSLRLHSSNEMERMSRFGD